MSEDALLKLFDIPSLITIIVMLVIIFIFLKLLGLDKVFLLFGRMAAIGIDFIDGLKNGKKALVKSFKNIRKDGKNKRKDTLEERKKKHNELQTKYKNNTDTILKIKDKLKELNEINENNKKIIEDLNNKSQNGVAVKITTNIQKNNEDISKKISSIEMSIKKILDSVKDISNSKL
jgi:predicted RNase H-like nuclease (RuvC/YqgF family)